MRSLRLAFPVLLLVGLVGCDSDEANPPALGAACGGARLFALDADPGAPGPWPVGARTVTIDKLKVEIWYPAKRTSEQGLAKARYDIREHLPAQYRAAIPDAMNPWQECDCYRDLPLDWRRGPYPVVLFIHGTVGFRTQTLTQMTHWASRGFVVLAADHPGIDLDDYLGGNFSFGDQAGDADGLLATLGNLPGDAAFLNGHLDLDRLAVTGHSAGGAATAKVTVRPGLRVRMPMAAGGTAADGTLESTLVLGGADDMVVPAMNQADGYAMSPVRKRRVSLANAGHLAFSDLCVIGRDQGGLLAIAQSVGIQVDALVSKLAQDGCGPTQLAPEAGWAVINHATSAVLEETLRCDGTMTAAAAATAQLPNVAVYAEQLE